MLLNEFLALQCLVICSKTLNYFLISIATNLKQIGLTDRDLGLTEMGLQTLCFPSLRFGLTEMSGRSHRDGLTNLL